MGKRILTVLVVVAVLYAVTFWAIRYYRASHRVSVVAPPIVGTPHGAPPPAGAPSSGAAAGGVTAAGGASHIEPAGFSPRSGEVLNFTASVTKLNSTVANLTVKVGDRRGFDGKSAWHLQAFAHTENPYRMIFELDDQFDSYSEATNLASLQYELHLSERGQKVDTVERMVSSNKDPAPPDAVAARVLPGTRDPIGMLMYLRGVDWNKAKEVRSPVFDGHKLYEVRAVPVARDLSVSVTAGKYTATKIEIHVMDNGTEMKDAHFLLYISQDQERLPVLMEAVLPVATASVELAKVR